MRPPRQTIRSPATSFVGRRRELGELSSLLSESQLVTLVGPPGIGKSRLADELGASAALWCDLSEALSTEEACARMARAAAGLERFDGNPDPAGIGARLQTLGPCLVVLDGFDLLVAHAADTVGRWLAAAPDARFLVTSRERLALPGEVAYEVSPLALESDAVQLFAERARAARAERPLSARDLADAAEIVRLLDGLPLAIELAASQLRVMAPAQIVASLQAQLSADEPLRDAARAFDGSWQALDARERAVLAQLSVFRGGFSPALVREVVVVDGQDGAIEALHALRDKSLVHAYEPPEGPAELRFGLYSILRTFAAEKLEQRGEAAATRARHAAAILTATEEWCRRIEVADDEEAKQRLALEHENVLAVHRRSTEGRPGSAELAVSAVRSASVLAVSLENASAWALQAALLDEALATAEGHACPPVPLAVALLHRGRARFHCGRPADGRLDAERALDHALAAGRNDLAASAEAVLGLLASVANEFAEAEVRRRRALQHVTDEPDGAVPSAVIDRLVASYWYEDRLEDASALLTRALRQHRAAGHRRRECTTLGNLSTILVDLGDLTGARHAAERALELARELGVSATEVQALGTLGETAQEEGRFADAREHLTAAIAGARAAHASQYESVWLTFLGLNELEAAEGDAARRALDAALLGGATGGVHHVLGLAFLAVLMAGADQLAEAEALLAQARALAGGRDHHLRTIDTCEGHLELARARRAASEQDAAAARSALAAAQRKGHTPGRSRAERIGQRLLARALAAAGEPPAPVAPAADALVVGSGWFRPPRGERVDIRRRRVLRLVLGELTRRRVSSPGVAVSALDLFESAWAGETLDMELAAGRVYAAMSTLRRMGLGELLVSTSGGYLLDPRVPLEEV